MTGSTPLWAPRAWVGGRWREGVLLQADAGGRWQRVACGEPAPDDARVLAGPALPGLVDAHGHAFQRAFAGLAERRHGARDDFWSWRDRMYAVANAVTPASLRAIAGHLYAELLQGGYTQVCEFHYVRHDLGGSPYADPLALGQALADGAARAGIGLTLLPVLYERAGFAAAQLRADQRRFRAGAQDVIEASRVFARRARARPEAARGLLAAGLAIHSLRAAEAGSIERLAGALQDTDGPVHIHVAEQRAEVEDCLAATGRRPIAWLASRGWLDRRWQLVHATHAEPAEIEAVAAAGAGVVLCPSTEANLGDGLTDLPRWLQAGVPLSLGSDSHVTRCWREELRWLEYGQRLGLQRRNVAAAPDDARAPREDTAGALFERVRAGGGLAAGHALWGLEVGARADLLVADPHDPALAGIPADRTLDALVFSSPSRPWHDVMVAGRWVIRDRRHEAGPELAADFTAALGALWGNDAAVEPARPESSA